MEQMTKRFTVNLPDNVYADLERWSDFRGQALATVAAIAIEQAVVAAKEREEVPKKVSQETSATADSIVPPREIELARRWVAGDRLENGELGIVANLLGEEPEDLIKKQRKFTPRKKSSNA